MQKARTNLYIDKVTTPRAHAFYATARHLVSASATPPRLIFTHTNHPPRLLYT